MANARPLDRPSDRDDEDVAGDTATEWERSEQDKLPPRGAGSVHNQGEDREPTVAEVGEDALEALDVPQDASRDGLQLGGDRGPSNQGR